MKDAGGTTRLLILLVAALFLFGLFVWPSIWQLALIAGANGQALVRVNKVTGKASMIANTFPVPPPAAQAPVTIPPTAGK